MSSRIIGKSTRRARTAGKIAEHRVWEYLDANCPADWIILCGVHKRKWKVENKSFFTNEIDCILITRKHVFIISIKSHGGSVRAYADRPWTVDGHIVNHRSNSNVGFWENHEQQCYLLKRIFTRWGIASNQIIPKMIIESKDLEIEFGNSGLENDVLSKEEFLKTVTRRERDSNGSIINHQTVLEIANVLKDGDWRNAIPDRASGAAHHKLPELIASTSKKQSEEPFESGLCKPLPPHTSGIDRPNELVPEAAPEILPPPTLQDPRQQTPNLKLAFEQTQPQPEGPARQSPEPPDIDQNDAPAKGNTKESYAERVRNRRKSLSFADKIALYAWLLFQIPFLIVVYPFLKWEEIRRRRD